MEFGSSNFLAGAPPSVVRSCEQQGYWPTTMAGEPIVLARLERALLHSFAGEGPNPTALGACPGAAFVCNGRAHRSAPGWWAVFSCDMMIRCDETRTAGGTRAEQAELRFVPSGAGVMDGMVWTWQMTALRTAGQARLFVQDAAPYPAPLTNLFAYHALVVSRDALCARVAHLLGASCDAAFADRTFFGFVLDMTFGGSEWARIGADKPLPPEATAQAGSEARDGDGGDGGDGGGGGGGGDGGGGDGGGGGGGGGGGAPRLRLLPQASEDITAAGPPADAAAAVTPSGVAGTPALASGVAAAAGVAATSANGDKPAAPPPPWEGAPATAALFADFLSYRSPRVDGQSRGASEHEAAAAVVAYPALETGGPVAAQAIYSSADFEDKLDLLRARLPGRSSQELRQLLHQADGELHAVLAQVQTPQK